MTSCCAFVLGLAIGVTASFSPSEPLKSDFLAKVEARDFGPVIPSAYAASEPIAEVEPPDDDVPDTKAKSGTGAAVPVAIPMFRPSGTETGESLNDSLARLAKLDPSAPIPRPSHGETLKVRPGDTLASLLKGAGVGNDQAHAAITSLGDVYDPRQLRIGQGLEINAIDAGAMRQLVSLSLDLDFDHKVLVTRGADGTYSTVKVPRPKERTIVHRGSAIEESLYVSTRREGVPQDVFAELIKLFSWDVDFQRDIHEGDRFETVFEEEKLADRQDQIRGHLLYAGLELSGEVIDAYRFVHSDGVVGYFDRHGRSLRKFLLRTPIDGARLSSGFGMRRHPILGYSRMHKGTDFAAPTGTPVYAGGSGRVEVAGRNGGYGNYVRIRHNDEYSTAYAHLHKFAKGIRAGAKVRQGQIIGYVGTTGRSTGPHLHYEVLENGTQINAMKIKQSSAVQLAGAERQAFEKERARIDALKNKVGRAPAVASRIQ